MYDDLFPRERTLSLAQSTQRPYEPPEVGTFTGFGSALADSIPYAGLTAASAWGAILDAYGKAQGFASAATNPGILVGAKPAPDMGAVKAQTIDRMGDSDMARRLRERAGDYAPNPAEVGTAGQIVHGVASSLIKAGAYTVAGGPLAPVLFGTDLGVNRAQELTDQGVDGGTAALGGVASGVAGAVGLRLPAALGATRLQSAGIGAALNPALNVAEVGGIHALLDHADYEQIAAQYQPFDPLTLTVSALTGAGFGAAFHAKAGAGAKLTPDEHAAALTMNEVKTREGDTLARAGDAQAANAAHDAQALARAQLDAGEPVAVAERVEADPQRTEGVARATFDAVADDLRAELLADAGNRADPGEIPTARAQLAQLQNDIERIQTDSVFKAEAKAWQKRGLSRKQAESAARDAIGQRQADLQAQADRLNDFIETNRRAAQAEQDIAALDQGKIPDRYSPLVHGESAQASPAPMTESAPQGVQPLPDGAAQLQAAADSVAPGLAQKVIDAMGAILGRQPDAPTGAPFARRADTPEQAQAFEIATRNPDAVVRMDDGGDVRMADLLARADDIEATAKTETAAFDAAVNCALRYPQ